jgi:hypothetical protein
MTSLEFEDALKEPDNDASNSRLHKLAVNGVFDSKHFPAVAEKYLHTFCSATLSHTRRRWVGIALAAMLDASAEVARHMVSVERELQGIGNVILSTIEREETKIVAGIIMRQALRQHIEFKSFWASDKLRHSATNFPVDSGANWMQSFQSFLNTLGDLHLAANPIADPLIIYPASVVGSDGFQWGSIQKGNPIVIAQYETLTVLMPDESFKDIQFLDVPVANIDSTKTRASAPLHDSQLRATDHEPWDLVMTFKANTGTYRLNASNHSATELSVMCKRYRDAQEIEAAIEELRQRRPARSPPSDLNFQKPHLACRSSPTATTRQQKNKSPLLSSDTRGSTIRMTRKRAQIESIQSFKGINHASAALPPAINSTVVAQSMAKRSRGKLPKVTQATKKKAAQQLLKDTDLFEFTVQGGKKSAAKQQTSLKEPSNAEPSVRARSKRISAATQVRPNTDQGKQTRDKLSAEVDDEFAPGTANSTNKASAKRKTVADVSLITERPGKKAKSKQTSSAESGPSQTKPQHDTRTQQPRKPRVSTKANSSVLASRTSLIGGLLGSQHPSAIKEPFKVPAVPSRSPYPPLTPTHRGHTSVQPYHQPSTPTELRRPPKTPSSLILSSSPFIIVGTKDSVRRQNGLANTEILSSNSKPTPASPNAESTAISGHADQDDVDFEKLTAEVQTARLDPFQQRREGGKATSFIRRLTGDHVLGEGANEVNNGSQSNPHDVGNSSSDAILLPVKAASQPPPQPWSNGDKRKSVHSNGSMLQYVAGKLRTDLEEIQVEVTDFRAGIAVLQARTLTEEASAQNTMAVTVEKSYSQMNGDDAHTRQSSKRKAIENDDSHDTMRKRSSLSDTQPLSPERSSIAAEKKASVYGDQDGSTLAAPQQAIDDTRTLYPAEAQDNFAGDETLVLEDPEEYLSVHNASPVNFRSSPPMPGTPSSSHSSTSAELEPSPRSPLRTSEAEEGEWEATLRPHQRALHDLLMRVSKRVLRHVTDNDTAVTDIADVYANDGEHVVNEILQRKVGESNDMWESMDGKKAALKKEMTNSLKVLSEERKRVNELP